jgi:acetyltransferase-like isoleucine patch superfamily enzyme
MASSSLTTAGRATNSAGLPQSEDDWQLEPTMVRRGASIGSGAIIMCGVEIGAGAMLGAGTLVKRLRERAGWICPGLLRFQS